MDIYVEALGEVRTDHVLGTVTLLEGGKVKEIFFHDGDEVKEGETLFSLDGHQYQNQINAITAQIENKRQEIIDYETLKNAILQDKNLFNEAEKPFFYYQYEDYHIELQRALLYLKSDYSRDLTILNIKNTHYLSISKTIKDIKTEIIELDNKCIAFKDSLDKMQVKAAQSGIIVQKQMFAVGDILNTGVEIADIIPINSGYKVTLYIPESKISQVQVGQKVEYTFSAIPAREFGKANGNIISIAADTINDEHIDQKFYKATSTIDQIVFQGENGEDRVLQIGMIAEAHIISGKQRVITWLLNRL
jgi:HlyD family secretion protein